MLRRKIPAPLKILMSLMSIIIVISVIGVMSNVKSQTIIERLVGTWAVCTLDVENCVKIKVHKCVDHGDTATCTVSLP